MLNLSLAVIYTDRLLKIGVDLSMSDKAFFNRMVWYMTKDYQNLYRFERIGGYYRVVRYFDCKEVFSGTYAEIQKYMIENCLSHHEIARSGRNGK